MATPTTTLNGTIARINDEGYRLQIQEHPGRWYALSKFAEPRPAIPSAGTEVEIVLDGSGYVREIRSSAPVDQGQRPLDRSAVPPKPDAGDTTRDVVITRIAVLKSAARFHTGRPDAKPADVLRVAADWEAWVRR